MAAAGIGPGATVAIDLYNCNEWLEAFFAAIKIRAVPANVNYRYLDAELIHILTDSDAEALIFHASFADRINELRSRLPRIKTLRPGRRPAGRDALRTASPTTRR